MEKSEESSNEIDSDKKKKDLSTPARNDDQHLKVTLPSGNGEMSAKRSSKSDQLEKNLIVETPDFHAKSMSGATEGAANNEQDIENNEQKGDAKSGEKPPQVQVLDPEDMDLSDNKKQDEEEKKPQVPGYEHDKQNKKRPSNASNLSKQFASKMAAMYYG